MKIKRHFSLKFVILMPAMVLLVVLALIGKNHEESLSRDIDVEYIRILKSLERSSKIITALDYSFSNYYKSGTALLLEHNRKVVDDVCRMWPIDALLLADGRNNEIPAVDINYMLVGAASLCEPSSELYRQVSKKVSLAPIVSFLHDLDDYLVEIHYIDKSGYIISSPEDRARNITLDGINTIIARPYWRETAYNRDKITVSGPSNEYVIREPVLTMTVPVFKRDEHQGMLSLAIGIEPLIGDTRSFLSSIRLIEFSDNALAKEAVKIYPLELEGVVFRHALYYQLDIVKELKLFMISEKYTLVVLVCLYIISVMSLFYVNNSLERRYFKDLAGKDSMTGLLNRRGLASFLATTVQQDYIAIAVLDIDDFKHINDNFGHDVGDKVICYIADQSVASVRNTDAVARFGGEEFVIYMSGKTEEQLHIVMNRVICTISENSERVVEGGFTLSGGVVVAHSSINQTFEELFKMADEKLYQAKVSGKNRLVF